MLCTVVWDVYRDDERRQLWTAIQELLQEDSRDWSRRGVYGYWDPGTRELLYVGLATNLPERFAQHNRLVSHSGGNKADKIDEWFRSHERLGFTLLLQAAAVETLEMLCRLSPRLGVEVSEISRIAEGQLIELHRLEHGHRPPWNSVGGSTLGAGWATPGGRSMVRLLSAADESLFVARRGLRDLVADDAALRCEALVHGARMHALMERHEVDDLNLDSDQMVEAIKRFLMFRDGRLVDDLADLDDEIRVLVSRFSEQDALSGLSQRALQDLRSDLAEGNLSAEDRATKLFIESLLTRGGDEAVARDAAEVIATRYLDQTPQLRL
jgi:hypothetical protein